MYSTKGDVYKLHARGFIYHTPGEFISGDLCIQFKGLPVEILQKEGKFRTILLPAKQFISPPQGALIDCRNREASGQEKIPLWTKKIHY